MIKVKENATMLAKAIEESNEFLALKEAYESVMNDEASKKLFVKFQQTQMELYEKQMQGVEITPEVAKETEDVVNEIQQNEKITNLLSREEVLHGKIEEISQIITTPLQRLYEQLT